MKEPPRLGPAQLEIDKLLRAAGFDPTGMAVTPRTDGDATPYREIRSAVGERAPLSEEAEIRLHDALAVTIAGLGNVSIAVVMPGWKGEIIQIIAVHQRVEIVVRARVR